MEQAFIKRIVEAALLAAGQPLSVAQIHALFPEDQPAPAGSVEKALEQLREDCEERGVELVEVASGFRFQVRNDVHAWVARLWTERQTRYTRATLETLALIAYRQPITRGEIEQIRGVAVNTNLVRMLEEREWIRIVGYRDVPGKPALFGTTKTFLDYFNLKSLDQLPALAELHDIPELEPQLDLEAKIENAMDVAIPASIPATAALDSSATDSTATVTDPADSDPDHDGAAEAAAPEHIA
jgi:segregation and condensation protein B